MNRKLNKALPAFALIVMLCNLQARSQPPQGMLFFLANDPWPAGRLGFVSYPSGQVQVADTLLYNDFSLAGNKLVTAGSTSKVWLIPQMTPIGSLSGISMEYVATMNNKAYFAAGTAPYLRVHEIPSLIFIGAADTVVAPQGITDIMVYNGKLYLLYPERLRILDATSLALLADLFTPQLFSFGGVNRWIFEADDQVYIAVDFWTAVPRCSMIRLDQQAMTFDSVFFLEGFSMFIEPLPAAGKIYIFEFDTYYDPQADSVFFSSTAAFPVLLPAAYDSVSGSFFVFNISTGSVRVYKNGYAPDSSMAGTQAFRFLFCNDVASGSVTVEHERNVVSFLYDPMNECIHADLGEVQDGIDWISLYDQAGRRQRHERCHVYAREAIIGCSGLSPGIYFIRAGTKRGSYTGKVCILR